MNPTATPPWDVRLMNLGFLALLLVFGALVALALARAISRHSAFDIQRIAVYGGTQHNNSLTLRANVAPKVAGTLFTVDLARVRSAFEAVPWVRKATVHRDFPNRLRVDLQEHQPVALWGGDGDLRLINSFGEVFEANVEEVDQDSLPILAGPDGQGAEVLAMYQALEPWFSQAALPIEELELSARGSWSVRLASGANIEMGRGTTEEVSARERRFLKTLTQVVSRYGRNAASVEGADLRHEGGYAIRLRGVTTTPATAAKN